MGLGKEPRQQECLRCCSPDVRSSLRCKEQVAALRASFEKIRIFIEGRGRTPEDGDSFQILIREIMRQQRWPASERMQCEQHARLASLQRRRLSPA